MIMPDEPEVRVFDSVTAAVANSLPPAPPPYADSAAESVTEEQTAVTDDVTETPPPAATPPAAKKAARKPNTGQHVRAQAGTAEGTGGAMGPGA